MGRCDTDPLINQAKLVIELDSSRHYEEEHTAADAQRDIYFKEQDITVLRIPNNAVTENFSGVCEAMIQAIQEKTSPQGEAFRSANPKQIKKRSSHYV